VANRRHSARRIRRLRTYNVREAAKATGATPSTVRHWHKNGLEAVTGIWPLIFRGVDIIAFFKRREGERKRPCGPGRMYCFRCKAPKTPALRGSRILARHAQAREAFGALSRLRRAYEPAHISDQAASGGRRSNGFNAVC
jgi:hypothetical protein